MYKTTMAEQMLHNMELRGETGGVCYSSDGSRTMAEQIMHNENLRGGGLPRRIREGGSSQKKDKTGSND